MICETKKWQQTCICTDLQPGQQKWASTADERNIASTDETAHLSSAVLSEATAAGAVALLTATSVPATLAAGTDTHCCVRETGIAEGWIRDFGSVTRSSASTADATGSADASDGTLASWLDATSLQANLCLTEILQRKRHFSTRSFPGTEYISTVCYEDKIMLHSCFCSLLAL